MDTKSLYSQILGISKPWTVNDVQLNLLAKKVEIYVSYTGDAGKCKCGQVFHFHGLCPERKWRHLDTCQLETLIICKLPRVICNNCNKTETMQGSWATPNSGFTVLFENIVIEWLLICQSQTGVAKQLNLTFDEVNGIMFRATERGLEKRKIEPVEYLSIDEKSMSKGHKYLTVLSDSEKGIVLDVCEDRTKSAVINLFDNCLQYEQRREVKAISMDMWDAFIAASALMLPIADTVHDRFHISRMLNNAVDITRRQENLKMTKTNRHDLKNSKYLWLMNFKTMNQTQQTRFAKASKASENTVDAWSFKEIFRSFFECKTTKEAQKFLDDWYEKAIQSKLSPIRRVAKSFNKYSTGIINYVKHKITNAPAESMNAKIQLLKSKARGFLSFCNYRRNILFYFGGLDLSHKNS